MTDPKTPAQPAAHPADLRAQLIRRLAPGPADLRAQLIQRLVYHGVVGGFFTASLVLAFTGTQPVVAFACFVLAITGIAVDLWRRRSRKDETGDRW